MYGQYFTSQVSIYKTRCRKTDVEFIAVISNSAWVFTYLQFRTEVCF